MGVNSKRKAAPARRSSGTGAAGCQIFHGSSKLV